MATERLLRYVVLRVGRLAGRVSVDYSDSEGREFPAYPLVGIDIRSEALDALLQLTRRLPQQIGPYQTGVSPLAVFIVGEGVDGETLKAVSALLSPPVDSDRVQLVAMPSREPEPREFRLPLDIAYTSRSTSRALDAMRAHHWPKLAAVKKYGLRMKAMGHMTEPPDIVLVDSEAGAQAIGRGELGRPRLVISSSFELPADDPLVGRSSWVFVPEAKTLDPRFVNDLIYGVVHDQPLHEAFKSASRQRYAPSGAYLAADPASVNDLRMWDAMQRLNREKLTIESRSPTRGLAAAIEKAIEGELSADLKAKLHPLESKHSVFETVRARVEELRGTFQREHDALVPMARARAGFEQARRAQDQLEKAVADAVAADPGLTERLAEVPRRVVVTLERTMPDPDRGVGVERSETLVAGQRYGLTVLIGHRVSADLVVGKVPPIDPLLPPPRDDKGHLLHVVVYPLDFGPGEPPLIERLVLPAFGSSEPVRFSIVAPQTLGLARLRIAVYYDADLSEGDCPSCYHNHLLQTFVLRTVVTQRPKSGGKDTTWVKLEFSRTTAFTDFRRHGRRAASIAINANGASTHTLMLKEGGAPANFGLTELSMQKQLRTVRKSLLDATTLKDDKGRRTPRFPEGTTQQASFEAVIRDLAHRGADLIDAVFANASDKSQDILRTIETTVDQIVQVVRLQQSFYFPWTVLYDFPLPLRVADETPAPVCAGFTRKRPDGSPFSCQDCLEKCLYPGDKKSETYCVYGFWGTRLQVEQSLHRIGEGDEAVHELAPFRNRCVLCITALPTKTAQKFPEDLKHAVDAKWVATLDPPIQLMDQLWSLERPTVLVVLGHLQTRKVSREPIGARIRVADQDWLMPERLMWKARRQAWREAPNPVVILAACESVGQDLLAMNGFVNAFATARAGAVIGTETSVFESLARRFARTIAKSLVDHRPLGEALLEFRRELLRETNPLGLVFTAFGDAQLRRPEGETS